MRRSHGAGAGLLLWAALMGGCGGAASLAQRPPATALKQRDPLAKPAAEQFEAFSRSLEKLGANEVVVPAHLAEQLDAMLAADANFLPARYNLAALAALSGKQAQAEQVFSEMASAYPDFAPAAENAAATWVATGQRDRARPVYEAIVAKESKNQTSRLALARLQYLDKNYFKAIALCRAVLARAADAIEAFRILALSYAALGDAPMAELIVSRGLRAAPKDVALHEVLADLYLSRGDATQGVAELKQVVTLAPSRPAARARLAGVAQSFFDFGTAAQQYEALLAQQPNDVPTQICLAAAYKNMGRFEPADSLYQKVLLQDPNNLDALWDRSIVCQKQLANYEAAQTALERYVSLIPADLGEHKLGQARLLEIAGARADGAAKAARQAHDKARLEAIEALCAALEARKNFNPAAIGSETERIEAAWQKLTEAQKQLQQGQIQQADAAADCGFAMLPASLSANTQACAPMRVAWTQMLYQAGRVPQAAASIAAALACDAQNPDAQLIDQQLKELAAQSRRADAKAN